MKFGDSHPSFIHSFFICGSGTGDSYAGAEKPGRIGHSPFHKEVLE